MSSENSDFSSIKIIYEDNDFIALYKPAGILVHSNGKERKEKTVVSFLLSHFPEINKVGDDPKTRPGIVHRLDKDTSGVIIAAKNQPTFLFLKSLFQNRQISKTYLAVVKGWLKEKTGIINKPIGIKSGTIKHSTHSDKMKKEAITSFTVLKKFKKGDREYSLLEVSPKTGRTHQIRVHLSSIGHPIIGDNLYGKKNEEKNLLLHASSLQFTSPSGSKIFIESDPPSYFSNFLSS